MKRSEIAEKYRWNLGDLFPVTEDWEAEFRRAEAQIDAFGRHAGTLGDVARLRSAMAEYEEISQMLERLYAYAHMLRDEDNRQTLGQALTARAQSLLVRFASESAFLSPELLALPEGSLKDAMAR